jgi:hypothetical protein
VKVLSVTAVVVTDGTGSGDSAVGDSVESDR